MEVIDMPYTIIVCDDNTLYGSRKRKIMQREKLFNKLWILVPPCYNGYDMSKCTVTMRYLLPISREFKTETLALSEEKYEEYLKYVLPVNTCFTKEWGDIELNLTFTMLDTDTNGNIIQRVRKTGNHILTITQLPDWDSIVPDSALSALDQRILKQDAQIKALETLAEAIESNKADDLVYDDKNESLQLYSNGVGIGNKVSVKDMITNGIPVVDLDSNSGNDSDKTPDKEENNNCNCGCEDNVVEFGDNATIHPNDNNDNVVEF
jgi:hypothetical protein